MIKTPWAHFVAICGPTVGGVAVLLKKRGWRVTGSDKDIYPPASDYLEAHGIKILPGFEAQRIKKGMNMVVLGGGAMIMDKKNPEVIQALKLGLKVISWPQLVSDEVIKSQSIVVAGTYGKTTITAMIAWILKRAGLDPSYLIGGYPNNFTENVYSGNSDYSVAEGDEHPSALFFDDKSKFLYYKPKFVLITSAKWDHFNVFPKEKAYIETYIKLTKLIPGNGALVLSEKGENLKVVEDAASCKVLKYSEKDFKGKLRVIGNFNRENASGAFTICRLLGLKGEEITGALSTFSGVKRRLEIRVETDNVLVIEDFAQHPFKVREVLEALKGYYPKRRIILVLDPFASILRTKGSLPFYKGSFILADKVLVRRVKIALDKEKRVTGPDIVNAMSLSGGSAKYLPEDEAIIDELRRSTSGRKSLVLFCSSGGWDGLIEKYAKTISKSI